MTTNPTTAMFDLEAVGYSRRRLLPTFDLFYGTAAQAVGLASGEVERVLDLGAGTGVLSAWILGCHPDAKLTLLDGAPTMLIEARAALGACATYVHGDFTDALPAGPWDAVVSALAIHHLEDEDKRSLFGRVREALRPGGVFVNAEQVEAPTSALGAHYRRWHHDQARTLGASAEEWAAAEERMRADRCASTEDQLRWLEDAGFAEVDCLFKNRRFAVLFARRADKSVVWSGG